MNKRNLFVAVGLLVTAAAVLSQIDFEDADVVAMKARGVTDQEIVDLKHSYEKYVRVSGSVGMADYEKPERAVFVAIANAQADNALRLLHGVMCPDIGDDDERNACKIKMGKERAGVLCNEGGEPAGYMLTLRMTGAQRAVLAKWRQDFTIDHVLSVPDKQLSKSVPTFYQQIGALGYYSCPVSNGG
jgi:hypothetical protein